MKEILGDIDQAVFNRLMLRLISDTRGKAKNSFEAELEYKDRDLDGWDVELYITRSKET